MNLKTFHLYAVQEQTKVMEVRSGCRGGDLTGRTGKLSSLMGKVFYLALLMVTWVYMIVKTLKSQVLCILLYPINNEN